MGKLIKQNPQKYSQFFIPIIIIVTAIVFANTLSNGFVDNWDDDTYIINNQLIKNLNYNNIKEIFSSFYMGNYHPFTILSYSLEYKFFGLNPFIFHFTNYVLHILNVILVYLFIKRLTGKPIVGFITSLLFAIHPMHVESVAWISERKDVLYSFFFLLSLNSYSKYLITEKKAIHLRWTMIWFVFSLMSKSAAVCLPLVLVLIDYFKNKNISLKSFTSKTPFFLLAFIFGIVAFFSQSSSECIQDIAPLFNIFDRIFLVCYSTVFYIYKLFIPFNLCALHIYPIKSGNMLPIQYYITLVILTGLIWGALKSSKYKHDIIFGLLFYLITIVMVLQIIPIGKTIVSERYSYIPYIGLFFIIGQFASKIINNEKTYNSKSKTLILISLTLFVFMCSYLTYERNKVWESGINLFTDVIKNYPESPQAYNNRGVSFERKNLLAESLKDYKKAIELDSSFIVAYLNSAAIYSKTGKSDSVIITYTRALKINPNNSIVLNNRACAYKKMNMMEESFNDFNRAIIISPKYAEAYYNRGVSKFYTMDTKGACGDWFMAKQLGYKKATDVLDKYCK